MQSICSSKSSIAQSTSSHMLDLLRSTRKFCDSESTLSTGAYPCASLPPSLVHVLGNIDLRKHRIQLAVPVFLGDQDGIRAEGRCWVHFSNHLRRVRRSVALEATLGLDRLSRGSGGGRGGLPVPRRGFLFDSNGRLRCSSRGLLSCLRDNRRLRCLG